MTADTAGTTTPTVMNAFDADDSHSSSSSNSNTNSCPTSTSSSSLSLPLFANHEDCTGTAGCHEELELGNQHEYEHEQCCEATNDPFHHPHSPQAQAQHEDEDEDEDDDDSYRRNHSSSNIGARMNKILLYITISLSVIFITASFSYSLMRPMEEKNRRRYPSNPTERNVYILSHMVNGFHFGTGTANGNGNGDYRWNDWDVYFGKDGVENNDNNNNNDGHGDRDNLRALNNNNNNKNKYYNNNKNNNKYYNNKNNNNKYYNNKNNDDDSDDKQQQQYDDFYNPADDAYYNATATNSTQEENDYYEEPEDDFYVYVGDDNFQEMKIFPMEITDYAGFICTSLSIILSVGGGIGPGAILVAVYIIVMDFPPKVAIPLSCVTGWGVNTAGNWMNRNKRHPLSNRPVIDWDLILVMEPVILLGAIIGTYLNKIIEGKIIIVMLVLLLSVISHNTLRKARRMHHAEELYIKRVMWARQKRMAAQALPTSPVYPGSFDNKLAEADPPFMPRVHSISSPDSNSANRAPSRGGGGGSNPKKIPLLENSPNSAANYYKDSDNRSDSSFSSSFRQFIVIKREDCESVKSSLIEEEADPLPQNKITYIIAMFFFVIGCNILKGGVAFESPLGVQCGSIGFWLFELLVASWLILCTTLAGRYLLRRHAIKEAVGFDYVRGDIKWDVRTVVIYPSACLLAGIISGMFGIGVAVFVAPMLVGIGVNPKVASATTGCMNFFTAMAAVSSYIVLGSLLPYREYAVVFYVIGAISAWIGVHVVARTKSSTKIENNKRLERHSYMAYSMGVVVLVSALSMTVEALLDVINHSFDEDEMDGVCIEERIY